MVRGFLAILLIGASAFAQSKVAARITPQACALGEVVEYVIDVELDLSGDNAEAEVADPKPPKGDGYDLSFEHRGSGGEMTSIQIINGRRAVQRTVTYSFVYRLKPDRLGQIVVPAFDYEVGGGKVRIPAQSLSVSKDAPRNQFVTLQVTSNVETAYVNQPVVFSYVLRSKKPLIANPKLTIPFASVPNGFFGEPIDRNAMLGRREKLRATINGEPGQVDLEASSSGEYTLTYSRTLFPIAPGTIEIPASDASVEVATKIGRDLFGQAQALETSRAFATTPPKKFVVKDAPIAGRPSGYTGVIGDFDVDARYGKTEIKAGDGVTLTMTIRGPGAVESIKPPELRGFDGFDIYPPDRSVEGEGNARTARISWLLVPKGPETKEMPKFAFSWFLPSAETFKTVTCGPSPLSISGVARSDTVFGGVNTGQSKSSEVKLLAEDIRPIMQTTKGLHRSAPVGIAAVVTTMVLPPMLAFLVQFFLLHRRRAAGDVALVRKRRASKEAAARLAEARALMDGGRDFFGKAGRSLTGLIADKLGVPPASVTVATADELLRRGGCDDALIRPTIELLNDLDSRQYGGGDAGQEERRVVLARVEETMTKIDKALKR